MGALGPVFRTYEPTRDRLVAVKVFRLDIVPEQAQALAGALSRATEAGLFHPSIVEPIAAGIEGSVAYRAEEYVAAESLDVAMRHYAPAPLEKALPFVTQLAGAIDFARAAGIGHGGLHPRDVFLTPDEARATGFGVVEALEAVGIRAPVRRPYSAPERIDGQPWGIAADVFALAAITFELLTARRPAGVGTGIGTLPDGPHRDAIHAVLARAMEADPARRHSTALAFAAALEAAWRGEQPVEPAASTVIAQRRDDRLEPAPAAPVQPPAAGGDASPTTPAAATLLFGERPVDDDDTARQEPPIESTVIASPNPGDSATLRIPPAGPSDTLRSAPPQFADEFVDEQTAAGADRRPLEAEGETTVGYGHEGFPTGGAVRTPQFGAAEEDRSGSTGLLTVAGIVLLLIGFGAGYFVGSRDRGTAVASNAASTAAPPSSSQESPPNAPPPSSAQPFSDQAVANKPASPPSSTAKAPPPEAPPPVAESARASAPPPAPATRSSSAQPRTPPAGAPPVRRGAITVQSTPTRAGVLVNGQWRGRTPLTLNGLPFGQYALRIVQPGYRTAREDVALTARDVSRTVNVRLETEAPAADAGTFTGSVFVDSRPQGANVLLDGKMVGKTPLRLADVHIGSHVVRLELARHLPWSTAVRIVSGQEARVTGSLEDIQ